MCESAGKIFAAVETIPKNEGFIPDSGAKICDKLNNFGLAAYFEARVASCAFVAPTRTTDGASSAYDSRCSRRSGRVPVTGEHTRERAGSAPSVLVTGRR